MDQVPEMDVRPELTTKEMSRFVTYYTKHIRAQSASDSLGIYKIIKSTLKKGVTPEQIQIALEHYAQWAKTKDKRFLKPIRSFFTAETIREWQTPLRDNQADKGKKSGPRDSGLDALDILDSLL